MATSLSLATSWQGSTTDQPRYPESMDEGNLDTKSAEPPHWLNPELPYEVEFECESAIRRIEQLDEDQTAELCRVCLRHNFNLVNFLRQAIDRVQHLEIVIDELCELEDSQS